MTKSKQGHKAKNITVFRVTRPYLNLLMKPWIFFRFSGENIILCILKGEMPFKMHKKVYVPTLPKIFRPATGNTHFFYLF